MKTVRKNLMLLSSLTALVILSTAAQSTTQKPGLLSNGPSRSVDVPPLVAALVQPILDERGKRHQQGHNRLGSLLYTLTQKRGRAADEALVVLMCFDVGESQEETDAVIARGRRMLRLLEKYEDKNPRIPDRSYPDSMLKGSSAKADAFQGAAKAIEHGWHSTADNPEW
jgi:hypothetical protein